MAERVDELSGGTLKIEPLRAGRSGRSKCSTEKHRMQVPGRRPSSATSSWKP
jgi:hypothetical protein